MYNEEKSFSKTNICYFVMINLRTFTNTYFIRSLKNMLYIKTTEK